LRFEEDPSGAEHFGVLEDSGREARLVTRGADGSVSLSDQRLKVQAVLPPVDPVFVYGVGLNYKAHAAETGMQSPPRHPVAFAKAVTSVIGHEQLIVIPQCCSEPAEVDFEGELAVVIGRPARDVSPADALSYVMGYTIANDVTARRWQGKKGGGQWLRGKSFDTFCPLGPFLVPAGKVPDPQALTLETRLNGEVVQRASTADMIFPVAEIISHLSQGTTLVPGTVILTGTPEGVGHARDPPRFLAAGDVVEVEIEGLGVLRNRVAAETGRPGELKL